LDVQGTGQIRLPYEFWQTFLLEEKKIDLVDGQNSDIVIHEPLGLISNSWCQESKLILEISQEQVGSITIESLSIDIDSHIPIYPFQVQFLDQNQSRIYDQAGSKFMMHHPALYIYNSSFHHYAHYDGYIRGRGNNGMVYLPASNYTFRLAWDYFTSYDYINVIEEFSFLLQPNTASSMNITIATTRVYIEAQPEIEVYFRIDNWGDWEYIYPGILPSDFCLHFPENASMIRMYIYPSYTRNSVHPSIRSTMIELISEEPRDFTIQINFPFFSFFSFAIQVGQLIFVLIVIGAIIASWISLNRLLDKQPTRNITSHPEFISFVLALLGLLSPWLSWDVVRFENGLRIYEFEWLVNPLGLAVEGGTDRLITSLLSEHITVNMVHFVFWISLIAVGLRIVNLYRTETSQGFYAPYVIMALCGVGHIIGTFAPLFISALFGPGVIAGPDMYELSIGPFFSIAALLVAFLLRKDRWKRLTKGVWRKGD
jgi:hypothetical protein